MGIWTILGCLPDPVRAPSELDNPGITDVFNPGGSSSANGDNVSTSTDGSSSNQQQIPEYPDPIEQPDESTTHAFSMIDREARMTLSNIGMGFYSGSWWIESWVRHHGGHVGAMLFTTNESLQFSGINFRYIDRGDTWFDLQLGESNPDDQGKLRCEVPAGNCELDSLSRIDSGQWVNIACGYDQSTATLAIFVNGKLEARTDCASSVEEYGTGVFGQSVKYFSDAAPFDVGPTRIAGASIHTADYVPRDTWSIIGQTKAQYQTMEGLIDDLALRDEAGGDNNGAVQGGIVGL